MSVYNVTRAPSCTVPMLACAFKEMACVSRGSLIVVVVVVVRAYIVFNDIFLLACVQASLFEYIFLICV